MKCPPGRGHGMHRKNSFRRILSSSEVTRRTLIYNTYTHDWDVPGSNMFSGISNTSISRRSSGPTRSACALWGDCISNISRNGRKRQRLSCMASTSISRRNSGPSPNACGEWSSCRRNSSRDGMLCRSFFGMASSYTRRNNVWSPNACGEWTCISHILRNGWKR